MKLFKFLKLIRVTQWIKNLFVFVPLLFSLHLFEENFFVLSFSAFIIFCLASSAIYVINDIADIEADRAHPVKRNRPLPAGDISKTTAIITAILLLIIVFWMMMYFNNYFIFLVIGFVVLNVLYSFWLKNIVLLDVFSIAAGFSIRVLAGAFVIQVPISSWLVLTTMFISLFLAVMKRRSELVLVTYISDQNNSGITLNIENHSNTDLTKSKSRKVLTEYSVNFVDQMATIAAAGVIICYALYTVAPRTVSIFQTERLIYTTPFVVFGIFRFMYLEYISGKAENTTKVIATDFFMILDVVLYILVTILIIYKLL
jgi:4-hydroxybenzoate polyprenyltransferase